VRKVGRKTKQQSTEKQADRSEEDTHSNYSHSKHLHGLLSETIKLLSGTIRVQLALYRENGFSDLGELIDEKWFLGGVLQNGHVARTVLFSLLRSSVHIGAQTTTYQPTADVADDEEEIQYAGREKQNRVCEREHE
jgi:hypothetical protein